MHAGSSSSSKINTTDSNMIHKIKLDGPHSVDTLTHQNSPYFHQMGTFLLKIGRESHEGPDKGDS